MNVRELLQIELWSKRTTRKILVKVRRLLIPVAIVLGVLIVLIGVVFAIEYYWLTSGERKAGRAALVQIDQTEALIDCNCDRFGAVDEQAKSAVGLADQKAWTLRDRGTAGILSLYLYEVEQMHTSDLRDVQLKAFAQQKHLQWHSKPELEGQTRSSNLEILRNFRLASHKALD